MTCSFLRLKLRPRDQNKVTYIRLIVSAKFYAALLLCLLLCQTYSVEMKRPIDGRFSGSIIGGSLVEMVEIWVEMVEIVEMVEMVEILVEMVEISRPKFSTRKKGS